MHSCQANEQFIVKGNALQREHKGLNQDYQAIQFCMRGVILEKTTNDETAVLAGQCFLISRQYLIDHITEVEQVNHFLLIEI